MQKKLKIVFWRIDFYGAITEGGVPSMHNGMISALQKMGHEIVYVSSGRVKLPDGVKSYFVPFSKFYRNLPEVLCLPYNRRAADAMKKIMEVEKPDFIFQHHHDFNYSGTIVKRETGIPFLLHCDAIEVWIKKNWGKLYMEKLLKLAEEIQWHCSDRVFVVSDVVKDLLVKFGVDSGKIVINPNGCNTDKFSGDINGSRIINKYKLNGKYIIGFSGSFGQWHGLDILAESIKYMKEKIPNIYVLFIGDGLLRPKVEEIISRDKVEDYALLTGTVPFEEMPEYLAACDVLVSPSVYNEDKTGFFNSPIKLFEYLAMGKPIIATDVGQQAEVIHHEENGLLCPERDPVALADSIIRLYKDKALSEKISINARKDAVEKYDWKFNAQRIVDAYYDVIKNR